MITLWVVKFTSEKGGKVRSRRFKDVLQANTFVKHLPDLGCHFVAFEVKVEQARDRKKSQ